MPAFFISAFNIQRLGKVSVFLRQSASSEQSASSAARLAGHWMSQQQHKKQLSQLPVLSTAHKSQYENTKGSKLQSFKMREKNSQLSILYNVL